MINHNFSFYKFHGAGNDFILSDTRDKSDSLFDSALIKKLCDRHLGIGADGLILLANPNNNSSIFSMIYYNYDGSRAIMCGNGARCICAFANLLNLIDIGKNFNFDADDGIHNAMIFNRLENNWDVEISINILSQITRIDEHSFFVNTGVPHLIKFVENVDLLDVYNEGKILRFSPDFGDDGANVNFVELGEKIKIRTYEIGVEGETLACGTGICAAAVVLHNFFNKTFPMNISALGGDLQVNQLNDNILLLRGPATLVFKIEKFYL
ncbi:MAG: diaminopimelate epimerase [Bacteroidales bacterium]